MSTKYADLVEAEAEPDDPSVPEEPEQPQVATEKDLKALGRVFDTYTNGLKRVLGDDFSGLHECPKCAEGVPGFLFQPYDELEEFKWDPDTMPCPGCDGETQRRTGAKRGAMILRNCSECMGNGYVTKPPPQPAYD